jgi:hypothetical protein
MTERRKKKEGADTPSAGLPETPSKSYWKA